LRRLLKISKIRFPTALPLLTLGAAVASVWVAGFVSVPLHRAFAYVVILACLLSLLGIVSKEDVAWVKGLLRKK